jgi:hypothetical protein
MIIVKVFYCRVHLLRTLLRRFKIGSPVYTAMVEALNRSTKVGCSESLAKALRLSNTDQKVPEDTTPYNL